MDTDGNDNIKDDIDEAAKAGLESELRDLEKFLITLSELDGLDYSNNPHYQRKRERATQIRQCLAAVAPPPTLASDSAEATAAELQKKAQ